MPNAKNMETQNEKIGKNLSSYKKSAKHKKNRVFRQMQKIGKNLLSYKKSGV